MPIFNAPMSKGELERIEKEVFYLKTLRARTRQTFKGPLVAEVSFIGKECPRRTVAFVKEKKILSPEGLLGQVSSEVKMELMQNSISSSCTREYTDKTKVFRVDLIQLKNLIELKENQYEYMKKVLIFQKKL